VETGKTGVLPALTRVFPTFADLKIDQELAGIAPERAEIVPEVAEMLQQGVEILPEPVEMAQEPVEMLRPPVEPVQEFAEILRARVKPRRAATESSFRKSKGPVANHVFSKSSAQNLFR
jgi:hypothetical protein